MTNQSTVFPESNLPLTSKAGADLRAAKDSVAAAAPEMKEKLRHMVDAGKNRVAAWKGGVQEGIREKPIQSVLIAVAVGAVIGVLVGRRSR